MDLGNSLGMFLTFLISLGQRHDPDQSPELNAAAARVPGRGLVERWMDG
jgi:hypothetical protein